MYSVSDYFSTSPLISHFYYQTITSDFVSFPYPLIVYSVRHLADISHLLFFLETSFQSRYHMAHSLTSSSLYQNRISLEGPLMTIFFKIGTPTPISYYCFIFLHSTFMTIYDIILFTYLFIIILNY